MDERKLSPQGYIITQDPTNTNPFWEQEQPGGKEYDGSIVEDLGISQSMVISYLQKSGANLLSYYIVDGIEAIRYDETEQEIGTPPAQHGYTLNIVSIHQNDDLTLLDAWKKAFYIYYKYKYTKNLSIGILGFCLTLAGYEIKNPNPAHRTAIEDYGGTEYAEIFDEMVGTTNNDPVPENLDIKLSGFSTSFNATSLIIGRVYFKEIKEGTYYINDVAQVITERN